MDWILSSLAALLSGIFASMGLGGGVVLMIYLRMIAEAPQLTAQGINLAFFLPIGLLAAVLHTRNKLIHWKSVGWCILPGLAGTGLAALLMNRLSEQLLSKTFACLLLLIGVREILAAFQKEKSN